MIIRLINCIGIILLAILLWWVIIRAIAMIPWESIVQFVMAVMLWIGY